MNQHNQKVMKSIAKMLEVYTDETDKRPWVVAWSGGKDSTALMGLVVTMLESLPPEKRWREVHGIMSDTMAENPILGSYMHDQVSKLNSYAKQKDLPLSCQIVSRGLKDSYFVLMLGRGYYIPLKNGSGRWCTDRLKIRPSNKKKKEIAPSYTLAGTRLSESQTRKESIERHQTEEYFAKDSTLATSKIFMPIVDWTTEEVWGYLGDDRLGWTSTIDVRNLYKEATGECGINNPAGVESKATKMESCSARFGCWMCPVVLDDKSTEQMSKHHEWMEPLTDWRILQMKVHGMYKPQRPEGQKRKDRSAVLRKYEKINEEVKMIVKCGYDRKGKRMKDGQGTFTVEARKFLYDELIKTEDLMNRLRVMEGLEPFNLISEEEKQRIIETWKEDEEHFPHVVTNQVGGTIERLKEIIDY